ncbi:MAG: DUF86 domain-containing protein [Clostridia bacterium]|nr:DUF86 domain-containing protein [Deltaproteobacteria bacterium]
MVDDVALNKVASIERCLNRVREEYADQPENLNHQTKQDAIILNLLRACEAAIDLAMHLVSRFRLGVPQESRDAFELLVGANLLQRPLGDAMKRMVGFRNVAVHDYQKLSLPIVRLIIEERLTDFAEFSRAALAAAQAPSAI